MEEAKKLYREILEIYPKIVAHRRQFHQNPELSFQEYKTSAYIQKTLDELNIPYKILAKTGVVGLIGKGCKCVALRADIDALPVCEETGLEFSSQNSNIMHACGHDLHTAMLLGAAEVLKKNEKELPGVVKLIFQPAEEKLPGGASILIEEGVLANPSPEAIFGQHVDPGEKVGNISFLSGPLMASADELYWTIHGSGSHAAQPHIGSDAIITAAQLVLFMQSIVTKYRNPLNPCILSVTSIHGGSAPNIFPEEVKLMGTLRTFDNKLREELHQNIKKYSIEVCNLYNTTCELKIEKGYPPLINNSNITDIAIRSAIELFGKESYKIFEPKMWAEDFSYYANKIPATFWFLGACPKDLEAMPPLHNSRFAPEEEAMIYGATLFTKVVFDYLNK